MIFICGDTHILDIDKLRQENWPEGYQLTKEDYLIILGDVGIIWDIQVSKYEIDLKKWYANRPWTTLFVDGNHENFHRLFSNEFPTIEMFGSKVKNIYSSVFYLQRGHVYEIEDKMFFTFGGGESIDKARRVEFQSWWSQEIPNTTDIHNGLNNLAAVDNTVDYVITHTVYTKAYNDILIGDYKLNDPTYPILDMFENIITYKKWYASHFHFDIEVYNNLKILYNKVIRVGE